jgi:nucleoside diphosphate kinase
MRKTLLSLALVGSILATGISLQGCYGSFNLTKKVYQFNGSLGNKWVKSLVQFVFGGPVYGVTTTIDVLVLNVIEFWTGSNPVAAAQGQLDKTFADGTKVHAERLEGGSLSVRMSLPDGESREFVLVREENGISMNDANGHFLAAVTETDRGTVLVTPHLASR